MTIIHYIALAAVILFVPAIAGVIGWCFEQTWKAFVYTFAVVLLIIVLFGIGCWGIAYLTTVNPPVQPTLEAQ